MMMIFERFINRLGPNDPSFQWEKRGGAGYGITTTATTITEPIGTGPPSSTITKDRSLHGPTIAGSSGGFIGLISGIAIFIVISLLVGFYLYNRHRRRLLSNSKRSGLPTLSSLGLGHPSAPSDPYDAPVQPLEEGGPTPLAARLGGRPGYARQRSSEWELPAEPTTTSTARRGKDREWIGVDLPGEPDEAAYPLRSRSPRPVSPRPISPNVSLQGLDKAVSAGRVDSGGNPFDDPYDPSSRTHGIRRNQSEERCSQEDEDDSRTVRSLDDDDAV